MHRLFGSWLREAGLEPDDEASPKHWSVISGYVPTASEIVSLARSFYKVGKEDASLEKFGTALQDKDTKFSMNDDKLLLSVLAGAELIATIERDGDCQLRNLAALCLVCGGAQGARSGVPVPTIPRIAASYIATHAGKRASAPIRAIEGETDTKLEKLERELRIVGEETDMLWWLVSEYSRDRSETWHKVGLSATSIIAGKELADLTRVIPGPVAAAAFLDRIVRLANSARSLRPISVMKAIDSIPREWREQYNSQTAQDFEYLVPVSNAVKLSLMVSDGDDWSSLFQNGTGMVANSQLFPNVLAYQVFLERLLQRPANEVD